VGFIVASAAFAAIFVTLTLSAYHKPTPHDLPLGMVGPAAVTSHIEHALDSAVPGGYSFRSYPSEASAETGITQRQVNGALVASGGNLQLLVTQAGGTGPEDALIGTFTAVATNTGQHLVVSDVVPTRANDSEGLSSFFLVLSVLIPSLAAGSASALAFRRARRAWAVAAPPAVAVVIGLISAAIADGIAGLGHYAALAGIIALYSLAVSAPTAVLARIRPPLTALAVLVFVVFSLPSSGGPPNLSSFTPQFLGVLRDVLPLGIAGGAIRNVVYFGGHATTAYLLTLGGWALAGVVGLILVTGLKRATPVPQPVMAAGAAAEAGTVLPARVADPGAAQPLSLVVGFDDTEPARRALAWGVDLLRSRPGTLNVVYADHVVIDSDLSGFAHAKIEESRDEKAASVAAAAAEIAAAAGVPYTFERRQGSPADAILDAASVHDAAEAASTPVILTGRSHHAAHQVLGSVPVKLLHESPYPVLTIA
jgi:nucleotide-binding universal stress UspA family protein